MSITGTRCSIRSLTNRHRRIRDNDYMFPEDLKLSAAVQDLVSRILEQDPRVSPLLSLVPSLTRP